MGVVRQMGRKGRADGRAVGVGGSGVGGGDSSSGSVSIDSVWGIV